MQMHKNHMFTWSYISKVYLGSWVQLYSLAETPKRPLPRIWAHIRGRYGSTKIDNISLWPPDQNEQCKHKGLCIPWWHLYICFSSQSQARIYIATIQHVWSEQLHITRREIITVRGQSYVSRLPKYWPPTPLARRVCPPPSPHTLAGRRGGWGSIFWKTRDIGLASHSNNLSTI